MMQSGDSEAAMVACAGFGECSVFLKELLLD